LSLLGVVSAVDILKHLGLRVAARLQPSKRLRVKVRAQEEPPWRFSGEMNHTRDSIITEDCGERIRGGPEAARSKE
jgi:hypothetical protein